MNENKDKNHSNSNQYFDEFIKLINNILNIIIIIFMEKT